ncbi:MAG: endolytic transglycosylase MltG [Anaerolineae bacterium]|nr:endolytic transglycosylase MltG [Anaerolineae bacterium]
MSKVLRISLRLVTLVLALSAVLLMITGGFWYMWTNAQDKAPRVELEITPSRIEHLVLGAYLRYRGEEVARPANPDDEREIPFIVEPGESVSTVAYHLQRDGLISDAELFRRVVQYWEADGDIQVGVYTLRPNMTMEEIMQQLQHGRLPEIELTIVEGWRIEQIAEALEQAGVTTANAFLAAASVPRTEFAFLADRPAGSPQTLEGFLFPETHKLPLGARPEQVIDIMLRTFDRRVPEELRQKAAEHNLTFYEAITLASIVEREAVVAEERPVIASVYLNRLKEGMYLQADPTVQYAKGYSPDTGKWWNPTTLEEYAEVISAYNTYLNPGLPPGPICNPGLGSIMAVLEPPASEYLFFVAKGDGSHVFAVTYEEHLRNYELYSGR